VAMGTAGRLTEPSQGVGSFHVFEWECVGMVPAIFRKALAAAIPTADPHKTCQAANLGAMGGAKKLLTTVASARNWRREIRQDRSGLYVFSRRLR
jgi:hypothetical protein